MSAEKSNTNQPSSLVSYPVPHNEAARLAALASYHILDTIEEKDFDDLTILASVICQTPVALVSLVDKDRQWFKSHTGIAATETPREYSFCAHAIVSPTEVLIVDDARKDNRFATNPLVTGDPNIVFYAGVPLVDKDGFALGSLCVIDSKKKELSDNQVDALKVIAKQVTDKLELRRKNMELTAMNSRLVSSEMRLNNLFKSSPVAIAILKSRDLIIERANEKILKIWGKDISIIGKRLSEALPELEGQPFLGLLDDVYTSGIAYYGSEALATLEHDGILQDNYFNFAYEPISAGNKDGYDIMVVASDVTAQVLARKKSEDAEMRFRLMADNIAQLAWMADVTGSIFWYNQRWFNFTGTNFEDMKGWGWKAVHHPEHVNRVVEKISRHFESGEIWEDVFPLRSKDGSYRWFLSRAIPSRNEKGEVISWFGTNTDITEQHMLEEQKDQFISIASHELKTPVTSVKGSLQLLEKIKDQLNSPIHAKLIEQANRGMDKMTALINELLDVHRLTQGPMQLEKTNFTIAGIIKNCCNHIEVDGKHQLILNGEKDLLIYADEHRIEQVMVNLVNNAVKYASDARDITINVKNETDYISISVSDTGPGIDADKIPFLFDRYYRAQQNGVSYNGLGLGLYICSEIVKRHGGQIGVDSVPRKGTTFWFTLPHTK